MLKLETRLHTKEEMKKIVANLWEIVDKHPANETTTLSAEEMNNIGKAWLLLDMLYTDTFDEEY
jgi:hypothetical protein